MIPDLKTIWENKHLILAGLVNRWFSNKEIKDLAKARLRVCKECPFNSDNVKKEDKSKGEYDIWKTSPLYKIPYWQCTKCGCSLNIKPYAKQSKCPINKW